MPRREAYHWSSFAPASRACGTRIAQQVGVEAARVALGHVDDRVTRRYVHSAELELAVAVAGRLG